MLRKKVAASLFVLSLSFVPITIFADDTPITEKESPVASIASPASYIYTRADRVLPKVTFASSSHIVDVEYLLNDSSVDYDKPLPLFGEHLGTTTFSVVTKDIDGTIATTTTVFMLITTPESSLADIGEAYRLGLISKVVIRDRFIRSLQLFSEANSKREKLLASTEKRKDERAALLSDRMEKILDNEILDLLKKQEGRTVTKNAAALVREDVEALRAAAGL